MLLVVRPGAPSSVLAPSSDALVTSSFLLLVVRPGAPSSVLAPSSDALVTSSFLLLVVRPGAPSSVLAPSSDALVTSSFLLLVVRPGAPSSVLAPSSKESKALRLGCFMRLGFWLGVSQSRCKRKQRSMALVSKGQWRLLLSVNAALQVPPIYTACPCP